MLRLQSRKLVGSLVSTLAITGMVLGLAVIVPTVVTTELAGMALTLVAGLGGYQIARQARIDDTESKVSIPFVSDPSDIWVTPEAEAREPDRF